MCPSLTGARVELFTGIYQMSTQTLRGNFAWIALAQLILRIALWGRYYYPSHSTKKEIED